MATTAELQLQLDELKRQEALVNVAPASTLALIPPAVAEPGYTTTEFWGTVASNIIAFGAIFHPGFNAPPGLAMAFAAGAAGIANAIYAIGRSLRKKGTVA